MNYYAYNKEYANKQIEDAFIAQTGLDTAITLPYIFSGSKKLADKFNDGYHRGITVTCPGFYAPQGRILRLPLASPGLINKLTDFKYNDHRITNFEMETSAIYGLGRSLGHHCLSLNAIVANRISKEFSKDGGKAVTHLIKNSLAIIGAEID